MPSKNVPWRTMTCQFCTKPISWNMVKQHFLTHKAIVKKTFCISENPYKNTWCIRKKGHKGDCSDEVRHKGK